MARNDALYLLVTVKSNATSAQLAAINRLINTYAANKVKHELASEVVYEVEAPDGMAIQLDKELRAHKDVLTCSFVNGGRGRNG